MTSDFTAGHNILTAQKCQGLLDSFGYEFNWNVSSITAVIEPLYVRTCLPGSAYGLEVSVPSSWNEYNISALARWARRCSSPAPGERNTAIMYCLASVEEQCGVVIRWLPFVIFSVSIALKAIVAWLSINFHPHFKNRLYNNLGDLVYFAVENPDLTIQNESLCSKRREPNLSRGTEIKATQKPKFWYWYLGIGD